MRLLPLLLGLCVSLLLTTAAQAQVCRVAEELALPTPTLEKTKTAIRRTHRLIILGIGGAPMAGAAAQGVDLDFIARLRAHLAARLPNVAVDVFNRAVARRTAHGMARRLGEDLLQIRPDLVIWESGGREAAIGVDYGVYARALEDGVRQVQAFGAELLLMDTQFAPQYSGLVNVGPYREVMRKAAEAAGASVFPRYDLMAAWHQGGALNLEETDPATQLAITRKLFDCLGYSLAAMIVSALQ